MLSQIINKSEIYYNIGEAVRRNGRTDRLVARVVDALISFEPSVTMRAIPLFCGRTLLVCSAEKAAHHPQRRNEHMDRVRKECRLVAFDEVAEPC